MGFDLGNNPSKYVSVYNVTIKPSFSEKIVLATLCTSSKTGRKDEKGNLILNPKTGKPERKYNYVDGRFVGEAFELAKKLQDGTAIDITKGWLETYKKNVGGINISHPYIIITEFNLSEIEDNNNENNEETHPESKTPVNEQQPTPETQGYYSGLNG